MTSRQVGGRYLRPHKKTPSSYEEKDDEDIDEGSSCDNSDDDDYNDEENDSPTPISRRLKVPSCVADQAECRDDEDNDDSEDDGDSDLNNSVDDETEDHPNRKKRKVDDVKKSNEIIFKEFLALPLEQKKIILCQPVSDEIASKFHMNQADKDAANQYSMADFSNFFARDKQKPLPTEFDEKSGVYFGCGMRRSRKFFFDGRCGGFRLRTSYVVYKRFSGDIPNQSLYFGKHTDFEKVSISLTVSKKAGDISRQIWSSLRSTLEFLSDKFYAALEKGSQRGNLHAQAIFEVKISSDYNTSLSALKKELRSRINLDSESKMNIMARVINEEDGPKFVLGYCQKVNHEYYPYVVYPNMLYFRI